MVTKARLVNAVAFFAAIAAVVGCESEIDLSFDLKTDLRPGGDLGSVRTDLATAPFGMGGVGAAVRSVVTTVASTDDYVVGERVAEFSDVAPGTWYARLHLLDATGASVVVRDVTLHIDASYAATIVVTRNCRSFTCPIAGGNPMLTACLGGRCVDPRCTASAPELCGDPACTTDRVCTSRVACARPRCVERECFEVPDDTLCAAGEMCDGDRGCVPRVGGDAGVRPDAGPMPRDGGPMARDSGAPPTDAGPMCPATESACTNGRDDDCDGDMDCADSDCMGTSCDDGMACTHGDRCASGGSCRGTAITCTSDTCVTRTCNGTATCATSPAPGGTPCTADLNLCTVDTCNGAGACTAAPAPNGSMVFGGDYYQRCCGGTAVDIATNDANCGGCGINCEGRGCAILPGTFFPGCNCAMSNAQCVASMGPGATCYDHVGAGDWYCNCQGNENCAPGQVCAVVSGHNYCMY